jgi:hypothetical protein
MAIEPELIITIQNTKQKSSISLLRRMCTFICTHKNNWLPNNSLCKINTNSNLKHSSFPPANSPPSEIFLKSAKTYLKDKAVGSKQSPSSSFVPHGSTSTIINDVLNPCNIFLLLCRRAHNGMTNKREIFFQDNHITKWNTNMSKATTSIRSFYQAASPLGPYKPSLFID